ncbi:MAG: lytic transglycosylase domain-containing protein [Candidatus Nanoarchaeia archaeon]|nr:lytic transglycosylase domain-containing protein [Candidatus Nanoarchaeia archaeon]MDD5587980.1 lytic transglycosylase domain-containing protein [Candidatus Nanoarchaeia archaeon]
MVKKFFVGDRQIYLNRFDKIKDIFKENLDVFYDACRDIKNNKWLSIACVLLTVESFHLTNNILEKYHTKKQNLEAKVMVQPIPKYEPQPVPIPVVKPVETVEKFVLPTEVVKSMDYWASSYNNDKLLTEAIAFKESGGDIYKVSKDGAVGVMQIMPCTALDVGLDIPTSEYEVIKGVCYNTPTCVKENEQNCDYQNDQRFSLNYNIRAGMYYQQYLRKLPYIGKDREKMLAAYNYGPGHINELCDGLSYKQCEPNLPIETKNYVNKVLEIYNYKRNKS